MTKEECLRFQSKISIKKSKRMWPKLNQQIKVLPKLAKMQFLLHN